MVFPDISVILDEESTSFKPSHSRQAAEELVPSGQLPLMFDLGLYVNQDTRCVSFNKHSIETVLLAVLLLCELKFDSSILMLLLVVSEVPSYLFSFSMLRKATSLPGICQLGYCTRLLLIFCRFADLTLFLWSLSKP